MMTAQKNYHYCQSQMLLLLNKIKEGSVTEKEYWRIVEIQRYAEKALFEWAYANIGAYALFLNCPYAQCKVVLFLISVWCNESE